MEKNVYFEFKKPARDYTRQPKRKVPEFVQVPSSAVQPKAPQAIKVKLQDEVLVSEIIPQSFVEVVLESAQEPAQEIISVPEPISEEPSHPCQNRVKSFCYVCGEAKLSMRRERRAIAKGGTIQLAYKAYFGCEVTDMDKWWVPKQTCKNCYGQLIGWYNRTGNTKGLKFVVPMIWREPTDHEVNCYFCLSVTSPSANRYTFKQCKPIYSESATSSRPILRSDDHPIPESPIPFSTLKTSKVVTIDRLNVVETSANQPKPFNEVDLEDLFLQLAPINAKQISIIRDALEARNLVNFRRSDRMRRSTKRKKYFDAYPIDKLHEELDDHISNLTDGDDSTGGEKGDEEIFNELTLFTKKRCLKENDKDPEFKLRFQRKKDSDQTDRSTLMRTIKTVSLNCPVVDCAEVCAHLLQLDDHLVEKHLVEKHHCVAMECSASFKTRKELSDHRTVMHADTVVWQCGRCQAKYQSDASLRSHIFMHHQTGHFRCVQSAECAFERANANRQEMVQHQLDTHYEHKPCPYEGCARTFVTQYQYNNHLKIHQPEKFKTFRCDQCEKTFWGDSDLQRHRLLHAGIKQYQCEHCGMKFTLKGTRDKHVKSQHKNQVLEQQQTVQPIVPYY